MKSLVIGFVLFVASFGVLSKPFESTEEYIHAVNKTHYLANQCADAIRELDRIDFGSKDKTKELTAIHTVDVRCSIMYWNVYLLSKQSKQFELPNTPELLEKTEWVRLTSIAYIFTYKNYNAALFPLTRITHDQITKDTEDNTK